MTDAHEDRHDAGRADARRGERHAQWGVLPGPLDEARPGFVRRAGRARFRGGRAAAQRVPRRRAHELRPAAPSRPAASSAAASGHGSSGFPTAGRSPTASSPRSSEARRWPARSAARSRTTRSRSSSRATGCSARAGGSRAMREASSASSSCSSSSTRTGCSGSPREASRSTFRPGLGLRRGRQRAYLTEPGSRVNARRSARAPRAGRARTGRPSPPRRRPWRSV